MKADSYKILIVEDEGLIAHDISSRLEALGHVVIDTVSTAAEAVEMAPQADLILMDIRIDGPRDGIDAAREIRQKHHLPVIFLTAHADRSTLERAKITGPFAYLVKPLASASLQSAIEVAIYRHRMERTLEEKEAWLSTTLASVADATVVTGPDGVIRSLNRAAEHITGWTTEEARGLPYSRVVRLLSAVGPVELAMLRDAPVQFASGSKMLDRSDRELTVEGCAAPVRDAHAIFGAVLTFRDVTAQRWQEQQMRQAQRMDTAARLAASVSEEYSNLVAIIRTQAEHLLAQFGEYSPVKGAIEDIRQAAATATLITRRMASFGQRPVMHMESFSLNSILRRMTKLIQSAAGDRIKVQVRLDPSSGRVQGNSDQLEQAVMNLVLHACMCMPGGGELTLETRQMDLALSSETRTYVALCVLHTGTESDLEQIFEPVAAQDQSLALPVAHAIVRDHGGYLTAQATSSGTRMEMLLPRAQEQSPEPISPSAPTILLIAENERIRAEIHNYFESSGYNLLEAADVAEAVNLGQMYSDGLDLLIAEEATAKEVMAGLQSFHPGLLVLATVDRQEQSVNEIRRPFSQQTLLERAARLLESRHTGADSAAMT